MRMVLVTVVAALSALESRPPAEIRFELPEGDVNRHLMKVIGRRAHLGIDSTKFKFFAGNYVSTYTVVDFDRLARARPELMPAAVRMMFSGRRTVWVDFRFVVRDGRGSVKIEKAFVNDVTVPATVAESMIRLMASTDPDELDVINGVTLPYGIKRLWTQPGQIAGEN